MPLRTALLAVILLTTASACQKQAPKASSAPATQTPTGPCATVDPADLSSVIACWYGPGATDPALQWPHVSAATRAETTHSEWSRGILPAGKLTLDGTLTGAECLPIGAGTVIAIDRTTGRARVQHQRRCTRPDTSRCTFTQTDTWLLEDSAWKRLVLPQTARAAGRLWDTGQYRQLARAAQAWSARDPDSISALRLAGWAIMRNVDSSDSDTRGHFARMLDKNPADSETLLLGPSLAANLARAKAAMARFSNDDCMVRLAAFNTALRATGPTERLEIIDRWLPGDTAVMLRVVTLVELDRMPEARTLLASDALKKQRAALRGEDPHFAGYWAFEVGRSAGAAGDLNTARDWLTLATGYSVRKLEARQLLAEMDSKGKTPSPTSKPRLPPRPPAP